MVLVDLASWLETDSIATRATNLFYGYMPTTPDLCIVLMEIGGFANEPHMGGTTVNLEFPSVQVFVRGARDDYNTPRTLIQSIVGSFAKIGDTIIGSTKYGAVVAVHPAVHLLTDDNHRHVFDVNFHVQKGFSLT